MLFRSLIYFIISLLKVGNTELNNEGHKFEFTDIEYYRKYQNIDSRSILQPSDFNISANSNDFFKVNKTISDLSDFIPSISISSPIESDDIVNADEDEDVSISGSTVGVEDGQTVTVTFDDSSNPVVQVTASVSSNSWTASDADISGLDNGNITVSADVNDLAGNSAPQDQKTIELDNVFPAISISSPIESDDIVNADEDEDVSISGSTVGVEDGQTVTVTFDDSSNPVVQVTASVSSNSWTASDADISGLDNGNITVSADVNDLAGNSAPQAQKTIELDNVFPAISISSPIESDDIVNADEDEDVSISGSTVGVEDGQTVTVTFDDSSNPVVQVTASVSSNSWTASDADISGLDNGNITVSADVNDLAGNSAPQVQKTIELDNVFPAISISSPIESDDIVNADEDEDVSISGSTVGVEDGQTVTVTFDDSSNPVVQVAASVSSNSWTASDADISGLDNGNITVSADVNDLAGNSAPQAQKTIELDNIASISIDETLSIDNWVNAGEEKALIISGESNGVELNQKILITIDDENIETNEIIISIVITEEVWSTSPIDVSSLLDEGNLIISAITEDLAGNIATDQNNNVRLDRTPPILSISMPSSSTTLSESVFYELTYSDNVGIERITITEDNISVSTTNSVDIEDINIETIGNISTLTFNGPIDSIGYVWFSIDPGTAMDSAGNLTLNQLTSQRFRVQKELYVTAIDKSKNYGHPVPKFDIKFEGFMPGDIPDSLTEIPSISSSVRPNSTVIDSPYPIELMDGDDDLYRIILLNGIIDVFPDTIKVKVPDADISWTERKDTLSLNELEIYFDRFHFPDDTLEIQGSLEFEIPDGDYSKTLTGTVPYQARNLTHPNYQFDYEPANLTIHRWPTIDIQPTSIVKQCISLDAFLTVFGQADPTTNYQWQFKKLESSENFLDLNESTSLVDFPFQFTGFNSSTLKIESIKVEFDANIEDYQFRVKVFGSESWSGPAAHSQNVMIDGLRKPNKEALIVKYSTMLINSGPVERYYWWGRDLDTLSLDSTIVNYFRFEDSIQSDLFEYWSIACTEDECCTKSVLGEVTPPSSNNPNIGFRILEVQSDEVKVEIYGNYNGEGHLTMRNLSGQLVSSEEQFSKSDEPLEIGIQINNLPPSIYIVTLEVPGSFQFERIFLP